MDYEEELEAQYNAINKYQEKIQDEKYEISKLYYTLANLENEKQQLIKFLEDKIKNYEEDIENSKPYLEHKELFQQVQNDIHTSKYIITNLKDVLDFVNKGGKNE